MAGPWVIETEPGNHYSCLQNVTWKALRWSINLGRPIQVEYRGPREQGKTRDAGRVSFQMHGRQRVINDPQWWENP